MMKASPAVLGIRYCGWIFVLGLCVACGTSQKLKVVRSGSSDASISLKQEERPIVLLQENGPQPQDTIIVKDLQGNDVFLMRAVQDEDGQMIVSEVLQPAQITATFRNVAERLGRVELEFQLHIPHSLQDPAWQLRFLPVLLIEGDSLSLEPVFVTGTNYRKKQKRGYASYQDFLDRIIQDSSLFRRQKLIDYFIERNTSQKFALQERDILMHYEVPGRIRRNDRRISRKDEVFHRKVTDPYPTQPIYLDTPAFCVPEDLTIDYRYSLKTRPRLRKAELILRGEVWSNGTLLYQMQDTPPLAFYISSIAALLEERTRYVQRIIQRRAQSNTVAYVDFRQGSSIIDTSLHENALELKRIEENILELMANKTYDIDSLVITSTCSPEGNYQVNKRLSADRGHALLNYFQAFVEQQKQMEESHEIIWLGDEDSSMAARHLPPSSFSDFVLTTRSIPEDWHRLRQLVIKDSLMKQPEQILTIIDSPLEPDEREKRLKNTSDYLRLYQIIFPLMRTVRFDFHLHRKGMVQDTIHTTEIDTLYHLGLEALRNRDFEQALTRLRPYEDYNTAIACLCMDYNQTARSILEKLPPSSKRNYMLALTCSRLKDIPNALSYLIQSVEQEPALRFRGNLDPEIASLIREYQLFQE